MEFYYTEAVERLRKVTDDQVQRLVMELDTGGNVRFEDGTQSDVWLVVYSFLSLVKIY